MRSKCFAACQGEPTLIDVAGLAGFDPAQGPPRCPHCGAWVRPDVVWFGEMLPRDALARATRLAQSAKVMLVVGTSGVVQPAASLPFLAARCGAAVIEVNPSRSEITPLAATWLAGPSGEMLPRLVQAVGEQLT
jgi:NAD-dependent deacetylase